MFKASVTLQMLTFQPLKYVISGEVLMYLSSVGVVIILVRFSQCGSAESKELVLVLINCDFISQLIM